MREISIRHGSRMANRMLQYLTALRIADGFPGTAVTGHDIAEWDLAGGPSGRGFRAWPRIDTGRVDLPWLMDRLSSGRTAGLRINEAVCDFATLPDRARANAVFDARGERGAPVTDRDLVIHVRLEDILVPGRHRAYGPLPIAWYRDLIAETGLDPVFVGQMADDPYSEALHAAFPGARFLVGGSVLHDFQTIRNAHHVAIGVSTFSWLAAWLGARASIHYPMIGLLNPTQTPAVNLMPRGDPRYVHHLFPHRDWTADAGALETAISGPHGARVLTADAAEDCARDGDRLAEPLLAAWRGRVEAALGPPRAVRRAGAM